MIDQSDLWAVVPVAGFGSRLRPHTYTRPKPLLPVAGQPIIGHILDQLVPLGVRRVVLVIGYMGELIVDYVQSRRDFDRVEWVEQKELLGLGHAIALTRAVVGDDPLLMVYGDTIFRADLPSLLTDVGSGSIGVKRVDDPRRFGVVVREGSRVTRLVEKPDEFVSDQAIVGVNYIRDSSHLYRCLAELLGRQKRSRGEYQLTDALQMMVEEGAHLESFPVDNWFDCGTKETMLATNRHLLEGNSVPATDGRFVAVPPVYIDPSAQIESSVIGPYVSVGAGACVRSAMVRNTIVGEQAVVENALVEDSLIGFQSRLKGRWGRFNISDLSEISS
ncbi:MAG: sugar phosphate nucleotidyltransferase [Candidatus Latescibacterota bacterium]